MKNKFVSLLSLTCLVFAIMAGMVIASAAPVKNADQVTEVKKLENPVTVQYIKTKLRKATPRLVLTPAIEKDLKSKIKTDPVVKNYYAAMKLSAQEILKRPVLTRNVVGRRLLGTSTRYAFPDDNPFDGLQDRQRSCCSEKDQ